MSHERERPEFSTLAQSFTNIRILTRLLLREMQQDMTASEHGNCIALAQAIDAISDQGEGVSDSTLGALEYGQNGEGGQ